MVAWATPGVIEAAARYGDSAGGWETSPLQPGQIAERGTFLCHPAFLASFFWLV